MRRALPVMTAIGCLIATAVVGGCGSGSGGGGGDGNAAVLRVGTLGPVDSFSPFLLTLETSAEIETLQYPFLVQFNSAAQIKPDFGRSWSYSPDHRRLTFKLATGGRWSDGRPLTSADVAWTLTTMAKYAKNGTAALAGFAPDVTGAVADGPGTVTVTFSAPSPYAVYELANIPVLPRHVWERQAGTNGKGFTTFQNTPPNVGGGPFYVTRYQEGQVAILKRNPGYYGSKPHVEEIGFSLFTNPDALTKALQNGEIDALENLPPSSLKVVGGPGIKLQSANTVSALWMTINSSAKNRDKELLSPVVRQALDAAVNRAAIVSTAYFGAATPGTSVIPPAIAPYHEKVAVESYDLTKANGLLDGLGYKRGANGIRVANGHPMSYAMVVIASPGSGIDSAANILRADFKRIGIELKVTSLDATAAVAGIYGPRNDYDSPYELSLARIANSYDPQSFLAYLSCTRLAIQNYPGYCDQHFEALYDAQSSETSLPKRIAEIDQMQEQLARDRPAIVIANERGSHAYRDPWSGFHAGPLGWFFDKFTAMDVRKG